MLKGIDKCSICGKVSPRDELIVYNFPNGPKLVCRKCLSQLPPDPLNRRLPPGMKRRPTDDVFPPVE